MRILYEKRINSIPEKDYIKVSCHTFLLNQSIQLI